MGVRMSDTEDRVYYDPPTDMYIRVLLWQEGNQRYIRKTMVPYYWAKTNVPKVKGYYYWTKTNVPEVKLKVGDRDDVMEA
jgi:hypothetical protein